MTSNFKRIRFLLVIVMAIFIGISLFLVYFQLFEAKALNAHEANSRNYFDESKITRGSFYDQAGEILTYSDGDKRINEYGYSFSHLIGYSSVGHGKSGLERVYNAQLLGMDDADLLGAMKDVLGRGGRGNDIYLTLDGELQSYIYSLLEGHKGSVVLMEADSGRILSMVSSPSFNVNELDSSWDELIEREDGVLLNRSSQGLYTPGSIIKVITGVALLESGLDLSYHDEGVEWIKDAAIYNFEGAVEGDIDLEEALIASTNTYFARKALDMGPELLKEVSERFYFNRDFPFELYHENSFTDFERGMEDIDLAASAYGQGKTLVTPLHMAMVMASLSQEGRMPKPYLVEEIKSPSSSLVYRARAELLAQVTESPLARRMERMLVRVVEENNYNYLSGFKIGGKTGTAENPSGLDHAWYLSFIKGEEDELALAIVLEEEGTSGGRVAAPMAQRIYEKALSLGLLK